MTQTPHSPHSHDEPGQDRFTQRLSDSAQQVWLAGLGAFNRAQSEGSKLFDSLVRDGREYEQRGKAEGHTGPAGLQDNLAAGLGQARERTARTWEKVENAFDDQVQSVLRRLQVPSRVDVQGLQEEIAGLRQRIGELEGRLASTTARANAAAAAATAATAAAAGHHAPPAETP